MMNVNSVPLPTVDQAKVVASFFAWRVGLVMIGTVVALVGGFWFLLQSVTDTINNRIDDVTETQREIIRKVDRINETVVKLDTLLGHVDWKKFAINLDNTERKSITVVDEYRRDVAPGSDSILDISGRDGTLRSCYANGGVAKQTSGGRYRCYHDDPLDDPLDWKTQKTTDVPERTQVPASSFGNGSSQIDDPALLDCLQRGGSLIQSAENGQYACAM